MEILLSPFAKINLGLFIKGKTPNGYHSLETLLYPIFSLRDELRMTPNNIQNCVFTLEGIELDSKAGENLCEKAYFALKEKYPGLPGVDIHLSKQIPAGAGLGGGSSDAAHTLLGLNQLFNLGATKDELAIVASSLGADVPFFLYESPMLAKGIGTELYPFDLELPYQIELLTPQIFSSTVAAYKALDIQACDPSRDLASVLQSDIRDWPSDLHNDLEIPVFCLYPELKSLKEDLYKKGALYAAMSGSGSAVFGLFDKK